MMSKMTPEQFCYWLNGHFDLSDKNELSEDQVKVIRKHLDMVFDKKVEGIPLFEFKDVRPTIKPYPSYFPLHPDFAKPIC